VKQSFGSCNKEYLVKVKAGLLGKGIRFSMMFHFQEHVFTNQTLTLSSVHNVSTGIKLCRAILLNLALLVHT